jgi:hypothetical protein
MAPKLVWRALIVLGAALAVSPVPARPVTQAVHRFALPMSLVEEHAEINGILRQAATHGGELGTAAGAVTALLEPHIEKERAGLSLLKLLPPLARGETTADMAEWLPAAGALRAQLGTLQREHRSIAVAANELARAAWAADRPLYALTAQHIVRHMRMEEEVLYPAAMVAADALRRSLDTRPTSGNLRPDTAGSQ